MDGLKDLKFMRTPPHHLKDHCKRDYDEEGEHYATQDRGEAHLEFILSVSYH